nr:uncharacterized protein LOC127309985 [Lolium perenne]
MDWEWGFVPLSSTNPPTPEAKERFPRIAAEQRGPCQKRDLDTVDPDPYVHWTELKMGGTHASCPDAPSASANPQVVEHAVPIQAEVGQEFLEKLASQGRKNKAPAPDAGSSQAPPAKRARQEVVGGKTVSKKHYRRREMPVASGAALKISKSATGMMPESSEEAAGTSPPPQPSRYHLVPATLPPPLWEAPQVRGARPLNLQNTARRRILSPLQKLKISAPATPAPPLRMPGGWSLWLLPPRRRRKRRTQPPLPPRPCRSLPLRQPLFRQRTPQKLLRLPRLHRSPHRLLLPASLPPPRQDPAAAKPTAPEGVKLSKPKAAAMASGPQSLVLHAGRAAIVAGETASAQLARITELTRGGAELGHLLDYAEKWNQADESPATRGLGKDKMPVIDPAGPRTVPEASIEALKTQLANLQAEKEQLVQTHRKTLDAQRVAFVKLKEELVQAELRHDRERKEAKAAAEAKLDETLKECADSTAVLRAELEEESGARKAAQGRIALLEAEQKEYDRLVV